MRSVINKFWCFIPEPIKKIFHRSGIISCYHKMVGVPPYEPEVCNTIEQIVKSGWICADVGANVGVITQLLAKLVGKDGVVFAFEANPDNAQILRTNVKKLRQVKVENIAVSDGSCERLFLYPGRGCSSAEWNIIGQDVEGNKTEPFLEISATSLDTYFPPGSPLNFVKIDVEGAEDQVLVGMQHLLREARPAVLIEFHNETGWSGREELFAAGYDIYDMDGRKLDPVYDVKRIYHCLALPKEVKHYHIK